MTNNTLHIELKTEQPLIPAENSAERIVEIHLTAPDALPTVTRTSLNLALVLDRSGSMEGDKLAYVKQAACHVLDLLDERDTASVVVFDNHVEELGPSTAVTPEAREVLKRQIMRVTDRGGTDLGSGWLDGCRMAAAAAGTATLNRALLLTDGQANQGITDPVELGRHATELRSRGVSTTTFGVGLGFNEFLLERLTEQGGGNFYFIENPRAIPEFFAKEFTELRGLTAQNIAVRIELPRGVGLAEFGGVAGGFSYTVEGRTLVIAAGSLATHAELSIFLRLLTPPQASEVVSVEGAPGDGSLRLRGEASARGGDGAQLSAQAELTFSYQPRAVVANAPVDEAVKSRYAVVDMADLTTLALQMERRGEGRKASQQVLERMRAHGANLNPDDQKNYADLSHRMEDGMEEVDRKRSHYRSHLSKTQKS